MILVLHIMVTAYGGMVPPRVLRSDEVPSPVRVATRSQGGPDGTPREPPAHRLFAGDSGLGAAVSSIVSLIKRELVGGYLARVNLRRAPRTETRSAAPWRLRAARQVGLKVPSPIDDHNLGDRVSWT